jgi:glycerol uptake facilitator-like aquaporin
VNPAITLCAVIMGEVSLTSVPIYVGSQIAGSLTGYALLMAVTPDKHLDVAYGHCVTAPHDEISLFQACVVEFMATFIMALAICASWDPRNYTKDQRRFSLFEDRSHSLSLEHNGRNKTNLLCCFLFFTTRTSRVPTPVPA